MWQFFAALKKKPLVLHLQGLRVIMRIAECPCFRLTFWGIMVYDNCMLMARQSPRVGFALKDPFLCQSYDLKFGIIT